MSKSGECIDCHNAIILSNPNQKRCWDCYVKFTQIPENTSNFQGGISLQKYYCSICKKEISDGSKSGMCASCVQKERLKDKTKNSNYIDGRSLVKNFCEICDVEIGRENKRCGKCAHRKNFYTKLCLDCLKPIAYKNMRCKECHYKYQKASGLIRGDKNPAKRPEVRIKMSESRKGVPMTEEWRQNIIKGTKGTHIGENNNMYGVKGKDSPRFGQKAAPCKGELYKNQYMRSSWEVKFAKFLDNHNIKWIYEPKAFDLGDTTYSPDFYLPDTDEYIEIKGWFRNTAKFKFDLTKIFYPEIKINLLMQKDLQELGIL